MSRPPWPVALLALVLALVAASDLQQVSEVLLGQSLEPNVLAALHAVSAVAGGAAAVAVWRRSPRAPSLIRIWGIVDAVMLLSVPVALELPRAAFFAIAGNALVVLVLAGAAAWWMTRVVRRVADDRVGAETA